MAISGRQSGSLRRRWTAVATILAAASLLAAACGSASPGTSKQAGSRGGTLTIATEFSNGSLDPAKGNAGTDTAYLDEIFAPLIRYGTNGHLQGVLATSWKYVGSDYKTFQIDLRHGVEFSNGQPLNAAAVVASIKHYETSGNDWTTTCTTVTALSAYVVQLQCAKPNPDLPEVLNDYTLGGDIVAPQTLAHPSTLTTDPIGAGEYTLDLAQTVTGSTYTYVANPKYFDQSAIHYSRIVVKYIANLSSALDAVRSGQVDWLADADPTTLKAAKTSGLPVQVTPFAFNGIELADRAPGASNPLGKLQVRQALEYAVNRAAIVKALYGDFGQPTDEVATPTSPTDWDAAVNNYYPYDPAKAKQLLAAAGYAHGLTISVEDTPLDTSLTQAVIGYWNAVGVKAKLTADPSITVEISRVLAKDFPVMAYLYGSIPMYLQAVNWFEPDANLYNPFGTDDPAINQLISAATTAPAAEQDAAWQKVQAAGVQQAWYVGVAVFDIGIIHVSSINVPSLVGGYVGNPIDVTPSS